MELLLCFNDDCCWPCKGPAAGREPWWNFFTSPQEKDMKLTLASAAAFLATSVAPALAVANITYGVPEISALDGTAALAVVVAVVLIVWERRRAA
jgi:hypothetical protein